MVLIGFIDAVLGVALKMLLIAAVIRVFLFVHKPKGVEAWKKGRSKKCPSPTHTKKPPNATPRAVKR